MGPVKYVTDEVLAEVFRLDERPGAYPDGTGGPVIASEADRHAAIALHRPTFYGKGGVVDPAQATWSHCRQCGDQGAKGCPTWQLGKEAALRFLREQDNEDWRSILLAEVYEALATDDPARLRAGLVRIAARSTQWVTVLDRREASR